MTNRFWHDSEDILLYDAEGNEVVVRMCNQCGALVLARMADQHEQFHEVNHD
jgi:hypothetical protein